MEQTRRPLFLGLTSHTDGGRKGHIHFQSVFKQVCYLERAESFVGLGHFPTASDKSVESNTKDMLEPVCLWWDGGGAELRPGPAVPRASAVAPIMGGRS
jgi:hypothetical protein